MNRLLACVLALWLVSSYAAGFPIPPDLPPGRPADSSRVAPILIDSLVDLPDSIIFSDVGVGYCKDTIFILQATQVVRKVLTFSVSGDAAFSVITDTSLLATDTVQFTVRLCPDRDGIFFGRLTVMGDEDSAEILLFGSATQTALPFGGSTFRNLGTIYRDSSRYDTTSIGLGEMEFFEIQDVSFRGQPAPLVFQVLEPQRPVLLFRSGSDSARLIVKAEGLQLGGYRHKLTISTSMGWRDIEFLVQVDTLKVERRYPRVEVIPPDVDFGGVPVGGCIERTVTIRNLGDVPVLPEHLPIASDGGAFAIVQSGTSFRTLNKDDTVDVTYRFCPDSARPFNGADSVLLGFDGTDSTFSIVLSGYGFNGFWENVPGQVDFGAVQLDSCRDTTLTFPNILAVNVFRAWFERTGNDNIGFTVLSPQPGMIESGDSLRVHMRFCPSRSGAVADIFLLDSAQSGRLLSIPVTGRGIVGELEFKGSVEFGPVDVGACAVQNVIITNTGEGLASLDWFEDQVAPPFTLLDKPRRPHVLGPNESDTVSIQFCPNAEGDFQTTWTGDSRTGTKLQIVMTGQGRLLEGRDLWLDIATANVGDPIRLTLRSAVAFTAQEGILFDSALIHFNYHSIVPQQVIGMAVPGAGGELVWEHVRDSLFRVRRVRGTAPVEGRDLFALEFIGLSSGQPVNYVRVEGIWFNRSIDPHITNIGQVNLIGCDIGRTPTFTKRVAIRAIQSDPLSSAVDIAYNAPQGSMPMLGLVNLEGRRVFTRELPPGTGNEQSLHVSLEGVPAGMYLLELRVEDDMTTARIMVRE